MSRYSVAPKARNDLDAIWDYIGIENSDPAAADRLIEEFFCAFTVLGSQPLMAEQCHEFEHLAPGLRHFPVGSYIIYYTPTDAGIRIGHIAHGMRDQEELIHRWLLSDDFDRG